MYDEHINALKNFNALYKKIDSQYGKIAQAAGLSISAFDIFYTVYMLGDGCLQKDVCAAAFTSKQTINSSIKKLEKDGYIILKQGRGRQKHIFLTPRGKRLLDEKIAPIVGSELRSFGEMTAEEREELIALMEKYISLLVKNTDKLHKEI